MNRQLRNRNLLLLAISSVPVALVAMLAWVGVFTFVNGYLVRDLGYSNQQWTASTLWFLGGLIVWQLVCTEITTRIGRRRSIIAAMLLAGAAYFGLALTSNLWMIRVLMGMMGFIVATTGAAWFPMIAAAGGNQPGRSMAVYQAVAITTGSLGLVAGGYLIAAISYHSAFLVTSVTCVICALVFMVFTRPLASADQTKVVSLMQLSRGDLARLATGPFAVIILVGVCLEPFNFHTMNQLAPNLARDVHHVSEMNISTLVALGRLPAPLVLTLMAHFVDRLNVLRYYGVAVILAGTCVAGLGEAPSAVVIFTVYSLYYLIYGVVWGTNNPAIDRAVVPGLRDSAFTLMATASLVATFAVGVVHNRLVSAGLTLPQIFLISGIIAAVAGAMLFVYSFSRHSRIQPIREEAGDTTEQLQYCTADKA